MLWDGAYSKFFYVKIHAKIGKKVLPSNFLWGYIATNSDKNITFAKL